MHGRRRVHTISSWKLELSLARVLKPGGLACTYESDLHCDAAYSIENVIIEMTKISKYSLRICSHKNKSVCSVHFSHGLVVS